MMTDVALLDAASNLRVQAEVIPIRAATRRPSAAGRRRWIIAGAGVAAAAASFAIAWWPALRPAPVSPASAKAQDLTTAIGQRSDVTLADASIAHLNADTHLLVLFSRQSRDIRLDRGEAMFEVAHNPRRPFNVAAGGVTVTAVGTVFDVERIAEVTQVRVYQGVVNVARPGAAKTLVRAGEWLSLDPEQGAAKGAFAPDTYQDWRKDWLQADNMPLKFAIARLNRYSPQKIVLADKTLADSKLTGRFDLRRTDATLTMISSLLKLKAVHEGDGLRLEPTTPN
jgi:transmembrane sensor